MVTQRELAIAADEIRRGGLVVFPTETVYGLGANALDAAAVARIFEVKGRPSFDPLIVHVASAEEVLPLVERIPEQAWELIRQFWPGPLSIVLPKRPLVPDMVTAGLPSVAVRCPAHSIAQQLIATAGVPIAAPSANLFGRVSPTTKHHVIDQFGEQLTCILDGGPCTIGVESTVVSFLEDQPMLLRPGGVTVEEIEAVVGPLTIAPDNVKRPAAPGQLPRHYAPSTPIVLTNDLPPLGSRMRVGLLTLGPPVSAAGFAAIEVLSERNCLREAATNLFAAMRRLDALQLDRIVALPLPEVGLGRAIMDRLRRAAAK